MLLKLVNDNASRLIMFVHIIEYLEQLLKNVNKEKCSKTLEIKKKSENVQLTQKKAEKENREMKHRKNKHKTKNKMTNLSPLHNNSI